MKENNSKITELNLPRTIHLVPMDHIDGFDVRPGFYEVNGATAIPGAPSVQAEGERAFCGSSVSQPLPDWKCLLYDCV